MVGHGKHCGAGVFKEGKTLCRHHLREKTQNEVQKRLTAAEIQRLLGEEPSPLNAEWVSQFLRLSFMEMLYRQHIILCFYPPATYGADRTPGHLRAIDFVYDAVRRVMRSAIESDELQVTSSTK